MIKVLVKHKKPRACLDEAQIATVCANCHMLATWVKCHRPKVSITTVLVKHNKPRACLDEAQIVTLCANCLGPNATDQRYP